jgi:hypothetical protein
MTIEHWLKDMHIQLQHLNLELQMKIKPDN